jgi:hypothetical protein
MAMIIPLDDNDIEYPDQSSVPSPSMSRSRFSQLEDELVLS